MAYHLRSSGNRLGRAKEHLDRVEAIAERLWQPDAKRVRRQIEADGAEHVYYAVATEDEIAGLNLVVSDCLHQMRAALDNLVYSVVLAHCLAQGKSKIRSDRLHYLAFPICDDSDAFAAACKHIWNVGIEVETIIEDSQPYKGLGPLQISPLRQLRELQNIDKHRFLLLLSVEAAHSSHNMPLGYSVTPRYPAHTRFEHDTEVARFFIDPPDSEMDMEYQVALGIAFAEPLAAAPAATLLWHIWHTVSDVVGRVAAL